MSWKTIELKGAIGIDRVCAVYEIAVHQLPRAKFKIKVLERKGDFLALPNLHLRSASGVPEGTCGLGQTELEALQDAITRMMEDLATKDEWSEDQLEWVDYRDFGSA